MTALDPEVAAVLRAQPALPTGDVTVEQARQDYERATAELCGAGEDVAEVADAAVPGPGGDVPVRVYRPSGAGAGRVVYAHGGGWVLGSLASFDAVCRALANRSGRTVVSVAYRLAPEAPFPAALADVLAATRWAVEEAGDPARVAVAGDSAGGNLVAVAARRLRDEGVRLAFQLLVYPVTDASCSTASHREFAEGFGLTHDAMKRFWEAYLDGADGLAPDASPLHAGDLAGLPPAWVLVAGHDVLRDEALAYAQRLRDAGVDVTVARYDDCVHGFWRWLDRCRVTHRALGEAGEALRAALPR